MKIKNVKTTKLVVEVTTKEMYDHAFACFQEHLWNDRAISIEGRAVSDFSSFEEHIQPLVTPSKESLENILSRASTPMFLDDAVMDQLIQADKEGRCFELHIRDHFNRLHVISKDKVQW